MLLLRYFKKLNDERICHQRNSKILVPMKIFFLQGKFWSYNSKSFDFNFTSVFTKHKF